MPLRNHNSMPSTKLPRRRVLISAISVSMVADSISQYEFAPMTVLVMSLGFIAVVCVLHVTAKVRLTT